jgi:hypothetical protein
MIKQELNRGEWSDEVTQMKVGDWARGRGWHLGMQWHGSLAEGVLEHGLQP